jgi:hypothetical protein
MKKVHVLTIPVRFCRLCQHAFAKNKSRGLTRVCPKCHRKDCVVDMVASTKYVEPAPLQVRYNTGAKANKKAVYSTV